MRCAASGPLLRTMSVSVVPGASAFTRMPSPTHSAARLRVHASMPAFAALYIAIPGEYVSAPTESTFSTAACALSARYRCAALARNTGPRRLTACDFSHASGVNPVAGWVSAFAALLTTMSIAPNRLTAASTSASTPASSPMCTGTPSASPPIACNAAAVDAQASDLRLATTTFAPAHTNPSAIARPMPRVPPVTIATRPVRSKSVPNFSLSTTGHSISRVRARAFCQAVVVHRTRQELEASLDHVRAAPADRGTVELIVCRPAARSARCWSRPN